MCLQRYIPWIAYSGTGVLTKIHSLDYLAGDSCTYKDIVRGLLSRGLVYLQRYIPWIT